MLSSDPTEVFSSFVLDRLVSGGRAAGITRGIVCFFLQCFPLVCPFAVIFVLISLYDCILHAE